MEQVLFEVCLGLLSSFCLRLVLLLVLELLFIFIASVETTRILSMVRPGAEAHPAKLVMTDLACHVVATLILLNWLAACRAWLRVCDYPSRVLAVVLVLLIPVMHLNAGAGSMSLSAAFEAEGVAALTVNVCQVALSVNAKLASPGIRAPLNFSVLLGEALGKQLLEILIQRVTFKYVFPQGLRDSHATP